MSNNQVMIPVQAQVDLHEMYGYPITTKGMIVNCGDGTERHYLHGTTAPGTTHTAAPVGSHYTYETSPAQFYIKADTADTWTEIT